jgi:hypothetical protein
MVFWLHGQSTAPPSDVWTRQGVQHAIAIGKLLQTRPGSAQRRKGTAKKRPDCAGGGEIPIGSAVCLLFVTELLVK